jgi:2-hydroxy-3-keto-5-methylthiopentenyl-1-phosphate phosphatase
MQRLSAAGAVTVFVGDGMSDQYAATCANVVFAKDKLAAFCDNASIPYTPYGTLAAVAEGIERLLGAGLRLPPSLAGKVFPSV